MERAITNSIKKQVLVLSDNDTLVQVIASSLRCGLKVKVQTMSLNNLNPQAQAPEPAFDLIVVAMSSPSNEPVVALARASLTTFIGQVPILIISDKSFQPDLGVQIAHLDFPFVIEKLNYKVSKLLDQQRLAAQESLSDVNQAQTP